MLIRSVSAEFYLVPRVLKFHIFLVPGTYIDVFPGRDTKFSDVRNPNEVLTFTSEKRQMLI